MLNSQINKNQINDKQTLSGINDLKFFLKTKHKYLNLQRTEALTNRIKINK